MKLSFSSWCAIVLLVISIGEGIYIYATRPVASPDVALVIAGKKSIDSVVWIKDSTTAAGKAKIIFYQGQYDDEYEMNQELRHSVKSYGREVGDLSDSLDFYRAKKDTPRFVMACDSLEVKADSLIVRNTKLDSMLTLSDNTLWLVGRQKDSVNDQLHSEVVVLKAHDSATTKQLITTGINDQKREKKDTFLKKLYIGLGVAATIAAAIFVK